MNNQLLFHPTPPPPYTTNNNRIKFNIQPKTIADYVTTRQVINGRDYFVVKGSNGESRLIPMRTPSAAIFQYAYAN